MSLYYTSTELSVRARIAAYSFIDEVIAVNKKLKYGVKCTNDINKLALSVGILEAIECYTAITDEDDDGEINCITEAELDNLWSILQTNLELKYPGKNTTTTSNTSEMVPNGDTLTTESGDIITTEQSILDTIRGTSTFKPININTTEWIRVRIR